MRPKAKKRTLLFTFLLLAVLIGLPVWSIYRQVRQERLNHALIAAIKHNDPEQVFSLLAAGADSNTWDRGDKPISFPQVLSGFRQRWRGIKQQEDVPLPAVFMLFQPVIDATGNVRKDSQGHMLFHPENRAILKALLDHGTDFNARDKNGETLLMYAAEYGYSRSVGLLLERGADVHIPNARGDTALYFACLGGDVTTIRSLIEHGADVNQADKEGYTPLMIVANDDHSRAVAFLLDHGASMAARDRKGSTALLYAAMNERINSLQVLLDKGALIDCQDGEGRTPLMWAVANDDVAMVRTLLNRRAKVDIQGTGSDMALAERTWGGDEARMQAREQILQMLSKAGARE
jgi:ankyrin repeat protein